MTPTSFPRFAGQKVSDAVRQTINAYTQALDDSRLDDVVALFAEDGRVELPRMGTAHGHSALRELYERILPSRPQRHLVLNTVVTMLDDDRALAVSDLVFVGSRDSRWDVERVGRYRDVLVEGADTNWRFADRFLSFATP